MKNPITLIVLLLIVSLSSGVMSSEDKENYTDNRVEIDYGVGPSPLTVDEGIKRLSAKLPTAVFKNRVKTTPIMVGDGTIFHWVMKDGSIWTKVEYKGNDYLIVGYKAEKE